MRSSKAADARPVRTELNSPCAASSDRSMRRVASWRSSSIVAMGRNLPPRRRRDDRADAFAERDPAEVAVLGAEDVDRQVVVLAERERGRVHHTEVALDRLEVRDLRQEVR